VEAELEAWLEQRLEFEYHRQILGTFNGRVVIVVSTDDNRGDGLPQLWSGLFPQIIE